VELLIIHFLQQTVTSSVFGLNILLSILFLGNLCFALGMRFIPIWNNK